MLALFYAGILFVDIFIIISILYQIWSLKIVNGEYIIAKRFFIKHVIPIKDLINIEHTIRFILLTFYKNNKKRKLRFLYLNEAEGPFGQYITQEELDRFLRCFKKAYTIVEVEENIFTTDLEQYGIIAKIGIVLFIILVVAGFYGMLYLITLNY